MKQYRQPWPAQSMWWMYAPCYEWD